MNHLPKSLLLLGVLFAWSATLAADPVITGASSLTPTTLGGGDVATFTFSFTNEDTPESSAMTGSQVEIQWGAVLVNGVLRHFDLISLSAAGGTIQFNTDGGGQITGATVYYVAVAKGATRTITANFQMPAAGLINQSTIQTSATLTWPQAPGTLSRSSTATLQAAPSLQVSLAPVPASTSPGGLIEYRAEYQNGGTGITRRAWMVVPVNPNTQLVRVGAGPARPEVWFSTSNYPLELVNSDGFIRANFQLGILNNNASPADLSDDFWVFPSNTRMMAVLLDDPALNLFPAGAGAQELIWHVRDKLSEEGTLIDQGVGFFCDETTFSTSGLQVTKIRQLPADLTIAPAGNTILLTFAGETGVSYFIQRSGGLAGWSDIGGAMETNPGFFIFLDPSPLPSCGFYRVAWIVEP